MHATNHEPRISFFGGVGDVTGANFLFEVDGKRIVIDCGMLQGAPDADAFNRSDFPYDPASIDLLIVTHAHVDHIGRIPKLLRDGFVGEIVSTAPTRDIARLSLEDNFGLMVEASQEQGQQPWYDADDISNAFRLWKVESYHHQVMLTPDLSYAFYDAGHILGSAMVKFSYRGINVLFTGDLGNTPAPLLRDTELFDDIDYLVMESVYGNRNHEQREMRSIVFEKIIEDTLQRSGTLLIPAFAVERTQELLFELNNLVEAGRIPKETPVFFDSPLGIEVTRVYANAQEHFKPEVRDQIQKGDDIFAFKSLRMTPSVDDSKSINEIVGPKIIVASSGMLEGGRIMHHLRRYISDPASALLFIGYQASGTLGRIIKDGARYITLFGESLPVKAHIESISGYSGHKQMDDLVDFVASTKNRLKRVWCVMGETESSLFLAQRLRDYVGVHADAPKRGQSVVLSLSSSQDVNSQEV